MNQDEFFKYVHNNIKLVRKYESQVKNYVHDFTEKFYELEYNDKTISIGFLTVNCRAVSKGIAHYDVDFLSFNEETFTIEEDIYHYFRHKDDDIIGFDDHWVELMESVCKYFEIKFESDKITYKIYNKYIDWFLEPDEK